MGGMINSDSRHATGCHPLYYSASNLMCRPALSNFSPCHTHTPITDSMCIRQNIAILREGITRNGLLKAHYFNLQDPGVMLGIQIRIFVKLLERMYNVV